MAGYAAGAMDGVLQGVAFVIDVLRTASDVTLL